MGLAASFLRNGAAFCGEIRCFLYHGHPKRIKNGLRRGLKRKNDFGNNFLFQCSIICLKAVEEFFHVV